MMQLISGRASVQHTCWVLDKVDLGEGAGGGGGGGVLIMVSVMTSFWLLIAGWFKEKC